MSKKCPALLGLALVFGFLTVLCPAAQATTNFASWLAAFEREAMQHGISQATLQSHLDGVRPIPRIIDLDRGQSGGKKGKRASFDQYLRRVVPDSRIQTARKKYQQNSELLQAIGDRFFVEPSIIVALWAIESDFGRGTGSFPVVDALATLAHEGRRGDFFRSELIALLQLIDEGSITHPRPLGSWAGAMGQVQFMPSSFRVFAQDFDGDGQKDIWDSRADALASAAYYLSHEGWRQGRGWAQKVTLPKEFETSVAGLENYRPLREWRQAGVSGIVGPGSREAALILPDGPGGPAYLVHQNFKVLRRWNRSNYFALAVSHLADQIAQGDIH